MIRPILFLLAIFLVFGVCRAFAGGADETVDPRNGCFANIGYSGNENAVVEADLINNRDKYLPIPDRDRYKVFKRCWESKARCVQTSAICRKDGNIVYDGFIWMWRDKK